MTNEKQGCGGSGRLEKPRLVSQNIVSQEVSYVCLGCDDPGCPNQEGEKVIHTPTSREINEVAVDQLSYNTSSEVCTPVEPSPDDIQEALEGLEAELKWWHNRAPVWWEAWREGLNRHSFGSHFKRIEEKELASLHERINKGLDHLSTVREWVGATEDQIESDRVVSETNQHLGLQTAVKLNEANKEIARLREEVEERKARHKALQESTDKALKWAESERNTYRGALEEATRYLDFIDCDGGTNKLAVLARTGKANVDAILKKKPLSPEKKTEEQRGRILVTTQHETREYKPEDHGEANQTEMIGTSSDDDGEAWHCSNCGSVMGTDPDTGCPMCPRCKTKIPIGLG